MGIRVIATGRFQRPYELQHPGGARIGPLDAGLRTGGQGEAKKRKEDVNRLKQTVRIPGLASVGASVRAVFGIRLRILPGCD